LLMGLSLSVLSLMARAADSFLRFMKEDDARKQAKSAIMSKYGLPEPVGNYNQGFASYSHFGYQEAWSDMVRGLVRTIRDGTLDEAYEACGDLAMAILVVQEGSSCSVDTIDSPYHVPGNDFFRGIRGLRDSGTYLELIEM